MKGGETLPMGMVEPGCHKPDGTGVGFSGWDFSLALDFIR